MSSRRLSPPATRGFFDALGLIPAKEIALATGRSVDTAKSWREGKTQPSVTDFAALCDAFPSLLVAFLHDLRLPRAALEVRDAEIKRQQAQVDVEWEQYGGRRERRGQ